jgi:hypothetical protein
MADCIYIINLTFSVTVLENIPTQKYYNSVTLRGNKSQHEYVLATTIIAFWGGFAKGALRMQNDLLMLCTD